VALKRRKRGAGTIRRVNGKFEATIQISPGHRPWKRFDTQREAEDWLLGLRVAARPATPRPPVTDLSTAAPSSGLTFGDFARRLQVSMAHEWRPGTVRYFHGHCTSALFPTFEKRPARDITTEELQLWLDGQVGRPIVRNGAPTGGLVTAATVRKYAQVLGQVFDYAVRMKHLATSPMAGVRLPKKRRVKRAYRTLTALELRLVLEHLQGRARAYYALLAFAGLRKAEALRMRWGWADLDGRVLRVLEAKVDDSFDEVPIAPCLRAALLDVGPGAPDELVFRGWRRGAPTRAPIATKLVTDMRYPLRRALKAAGIDPGTDRFTRIGMHTFRRTFLTLLDALPGVTRAMVRLLARHGTADVTDRYLLPSRDHLQQAVAKLEECVRAAVPPPTTAPSAVPAAEPLPANVIPLRLRRASGR
jgi:integrase